MARETIARYEIKSEIGRGGMAAVYLAYDPNFRRNVALKLISGNLQENPVFRDRFEREAHLIAKIEHPAIVPVYDYGEQEGQLYLVMRYMPGGSLADKIKHGVLTLSQTVKIIAQIAPALDAVHAQGVVHRDLKPGNILLDSFGNAAISDFGIAHLTAVTSDLTGSAVIGTPSYMSPEQVRGDAELDGRSDIYALGVIVFEMLTGRGPFQAGTPMSMAFKHLSEPVPSIRSIRPDLPVELEMILNKVLAKDRAQRYDSAEEFARNLKAISKTFQESDSPPVVLAGPHQGSNAPTEVDTSDASRPSSKIGGGREVDKIDHIRPSQSYSQSLKPNRPSRRLLQAASIGGLALILFLICSSLGLFGVLTSIGFPDLFSAEGQPQPSAPPTTEPETSPNAILFADDFTDPNSGWPAFQNAQGSYGYLQDGYQIMVNEIDTVLWAKTNRMDDSVNIFVDATPVIDGAGGFYGLLCRIQDDRNFYYFVIQSNGEYTLGKFKNGEFSPFFNWMYSDAIKQGTRTNRLQAECADTTLRFFVNDVLLGEVTDADFGSGFSGLIAATLEFQEFAARFNNFLITGTGH